MKNVWNAQGSTYFPSEVTSQVNKLTPGVYMVKYHDMMGPFLNKTAEDFAFPYKIYGMEHEFIERVIKTWEHTHGNMGILMNGVKGTGKTVTAKLLANQMRLPVLVITHPHPSFIGFLNDIQQDIVVLIDEFEKVYEDRSRTLLSIMDGVHNSSKRIMFLLTTNELNIDRNLLQRPSRIRYVKTFDDMTLDVIMEVVDDLLIHKHLREQTIKFISELQIITMDLVKAVINEVNIHEEDPETFKDIFNVTGDKDDLYNVFQIKANGEKVQIAKLARINPSFCHEKYDEGRPFEANGRFLGEIIKVHNKNTIDVKVTVWEKAPEGVQGDEDGEIEVDKITRYSFDKAVKTHRAFSYGYY